MLSVARDSSCARPATGYEPSCAAVSLILGVSLALREAGGSTHEYQHVSIELLSLKTALEQVATLEPVEGLEEIANAIAKAAMTCQEPLHGFLANVKHYDASLGKGQSAGMVKDVAYKTRWRMTNTRVPCENATILH